MYSPEVRLIKEALLIAKERIKEDGASLGLNRFQFRSSVHRLEQAHNMANERNKDQGVPTYCLFLYVPCKRSEIRAVLRRRRLSTLLDIVGRDIVVLERACKHIGITMPHELRFFHSVYCELAKSRRA